jgi:hypothetical protein
MNQDQRADVAKRRVVYELPGEREVLVRRDLPYTSSTGEPLTFDLYESPRREKPAPRPVVVLVSGYNDLGMARVMGCKAKEMESYRSWARLVAASGINCVAFECREPAADAAALLLHLRESSDPLDLDATRIGLWSCSGNVPTALGVLMDVSRLACAALLYGYTLDLDGSTCVSDAAAMFRFAMPAAGRTVRDLPADLPLFLARAGRDQMPGLNASLDTFAAHALRENRPLTLMNHHHGPHAFDLEDASPASRTLVKCTLDFLVANLRR